MEFCGQSASVRPHVRPFALHQAGDTCSWHLQTYTMAIHPLFQDRVWGEVWLMRMTLAPLGSVDMSSLQHTHQPVQSTQAVHDSSCPCLLHPSTGGFESVLSRTSGSVGRRHEPTFTSMDVAVPNAYKRPSSAAILFLSQQGRVYERGHRIPPRKPIQIERKAPTRCVPTAHPICTRLLVPFARAVGSDIASSCPSSSSSLDPPYRPCSRPGLLSDRRRLVSFSSDRLIRVRLGDRSGSNGWSEPKKDGSRRIPTRQKVARVISNQVDAMVASRKSGNAENGKEEGEKQRRIRSVSKKEGERKRGQEEQETIATKPGTRKKVQIALISTSGALVVAGGVLGLVLGLVGRSKRRKKTTKEEKKSPRRVGFRETVENIEVTPYSSEGLEDEEEEEIGIVLRVVSGPSSGLAYLCTKSQDRITVGRSEGNDLAVGDGEVSTVHVFINWSEKMRKWAVIDVGSLNGTRLNDELLKSSGRSMTYPYPLLDGDLIRLGSQTVIRVNYEPVAKNTVKTGRRADSLVISAALSASPSPEHLRAKQPIEDVCGVECPLRGFFKAGLFCLFDGHCGDNAAKKAKELLPQEISRHFFDFGKKALAFREEEETKRGLQAAIASTDKLLDFQYEGCTATAMLVWEVNNNKYLQVANVGDSACVLGVRPKTGAARGIIARQVTVDHRVSNKTERARLVSCGAKLPENATRLHGLSLSRALGDQFLKSQNVGLVSDPHVSEIVKVQSDEEDVVFAIIASDGLWDAVSPELAVERAATVGASSQWRPDVMSSQLLRLAKKKKSTDDVSVLLVQF